MNVVINPSEDITLSLAPTSTLQEIIQNVLCILNTPLMSVPCYREFGVKNNYLHRPITVAQSAYASAIASAISEFEPRAIVDRVTFTVDPNHPDRLKPTVEVTINE